MCRQTSGDAFHSCAPVVFYFTSFDEMLWAINKSWCMAWRADGLDPSEKMGRLMSIELGQCLATEEWAWLCYIKHYYPQISIRLSLFVKQCVISNIWFIMQFNNSGIFLLPFFRWRQSIRFVKQARLTKMLMLMMYALQDKSGGHSCWIRLMKRRISQQSVRE